MFFTRNRTPNLRLVPKQNVKLRKEKCPYLREKEKKNPNSLV